MSEQHNILCGFHAVYAAIGQDGYISEVMVDTDRSDARMKKLIDLAQSHSVKVTRSAARLWMNKREGLNIRV